MALRLTCRAPRNGRGILHLRPNRRAVLRRLEKAMREIITDPAFAPLLGCELLEDELRLGIYPWEEPIRFTFDEDDSLVCSARTSGAGPGYHAFVVDFLGMLGRSCDLKWDWVKPTGECGDDTGYQEHHDFARLQDTMLEWLQDTANKVIALRNAGRPVRSINIPMEALLPKPSAHQDLYSPTGHLTLEWLVQVARKPISYLGPYGAAFFPWWQRECTAEFWRSLGLAQAWVEVPWHAPVNDTELTRMELAREYFRRARDLDPRIELPEDSIEELGRLMAQTPETATPPVPEGIGYRRQVVEMPLQHGWKMDLPGYYYIATDEQEDAAIFRFGKRSIRATAMPPRDCDLHGWTPEELLANLSADFPPDAEIVEESRVGAVGRAGVYTAVVDGQSRRVLRGHWAMGNRASTIVITFSDEADREWALETWRSVRHPAESEVKARRGLALTNYRSGAA